MMLALPGCTGGAAAARACCRSVEAGAEAGAPLGPLRMGKALGPEARTANVPADMVVAMDGAGANKPWVKTSSSLLRYTSPALPNEKLT